MNRYKHKFYFQNKKFYIKIKYFILKINYKNVEEFKINDDGNIFYKNSRNTKIGCNIKR